MGSEHLAVFLKSLAGGGAQRVLLDLAIEFAARGHRVDMLLARREGPLLDGVPDSLRLVDLGVGSAWDGLPSLLRSERKDLRPLLATYLLGAPPLVFGGIAPLADYLREERPAAMLSAVDFTNLAALLAARRSKGETRQVVSVHNTLSMVVSRRKKARLRMLPELTHRIFPEAHGIAACSIGVADDLAELCRLPRASVTPIYNPIVGPEDRAGSSEPVEDPWLAPGEPPVVLGVGRLAPQKDFALLLHAFARARTQRSMRLLILGEGAERAQLERLARRIGIGDDLRMPGWVENPLAFAARASLLVCSSAWEGFGNVLVEALSVGCPCVSTRTHGPTEILDGGRYGALVPHGDVDALSEAIVATLDAPPPAERSIARAREFSVERSADRYLDLMLGPARDRARPAGPVDRPD